jgi:predicted O-methyltransferase YrrM
MKKFLYRLLQSLHFRKSLKKLKKLENALLTQKQKLTIPFLYRGSGFFKSISCMQNPHEIEELYHLVCDLKPKRVLEIGTAKGGALYLWSQAAHDEAQIISLDLPGGEFGGGYPSCRIPFYHSFIKRNQQLHLVRKDSHSKEALKDIVDLLKGEPLDFLFIDGDHTYEGVKRDFEMYSPLVRPNGLIALHDILPRPDIPTIQVDRFWNEIKNLYPSKELIGPDGHSRKIGCGVLRPTI